MPVACRRKSFIRSNCGKGLMAKRRTSHDILRGTRGRQNRTRKQLCRLNRLIISVALRVESFGTTTYFTSAPFCHKSPVSCCDRSAPRLTHHGRNGAMTLGVGHALANRCRIAAAVPGARPHYTYARGVLFRTRMTCKLSFAQRYLQRADAMEGWSPETGSTYAALVEHRI